MYTQNISNDTTNYTSAIQPLVKSDDWKVAIWDSITIVWNAITSTFTPSRTLLSNISNMLSNNISDILSNNTNNFSDVSSEDVNESDTSYNTIITVGILSGLAVGGAAVLGTAAYIYTFNHKKNDSTTDSNNYAIIPLNEEDQHRVQNHELSGDYQVYNTCVY